LIGFDEKIAGNIIDEHAQDIVHMITGGW